MITLLLGDQFYLLKDNKHADSMFVTVDVYIIACLSLCMMMVTVINKSILLYEPCMKCFQQFYYCITCLADQVDASPLGQMHKT